MPGFPHPAAGPAFPPPSGEPAGRRPSSPPPPPAPAPSDRGRGPAAAPASGADAEGRRPLAGFAYSFQEDAFGKHWLLFEGENLVGRAETNVKCEIPIAHGTTSTRHATFRCANGSISIVDMKSTNGTYVNGRRLDPNVPTPLNDGDKVRFGGFTVSLVIALRT